MLNCTRELLLLPVLLLLVITISQSFLGLLLFLLCVARSKSVSVTADLRILSHESHLDGSLRSLLRRLMNGRANEWPKRSH